MSMMAEMMGDMLKKALPPEVMELLTPEKVKSFGDKANEFIGDLRSSLARIEAGQALILERLGNVGNNDSDGTEQPALGSDRSGSGSDRGDATSNG